MRLKRTIETGVEGTRVICCGCRAWVRLDTVYADLDGPAFEAYYCEPCGQELNARHNVTLPDGEYRL